MSAYWFEPREIAVLIGQPVKDWPFRMVRNHTDHKESEQNILTKIPRASSSEISNTRNLTRSWKYLHSENKKALLGELKGCPGKRRALCPPHPLHTTTRWLLSKLTDLRMWFDPIKIPTGCSVEFEKLILKCVWKCKLPRLADTLLQNKDGEAAQPSVQSYRKTTVMETGWIHAEQTESPAD